MSKLRRGPGALPFWLALGVALLLAGCGAALVASPTPDGAGGAGASEGGSAALPSPTAPAPTAAPGVGAVEVGTSIATGPVTSPPLRDITPISGAPHGPAVTPDAQGVASVTLPQDAGAQVTLKVGDTLRLTLGPGSEWSLTPSDPAILGPLTGAGAPGAYNYQARAAGAVSISATADPLCRQANPPCGAPTQVFQITVTVR
jgi:hypothetical protein